MKLRDMIRWKGKNPTEMIRGGGGIANTITTVCMKNNNRQVILIMENYDGERIDVKRMFEEMHKDS